MKKLFSFNDLKTYVINNVMPGEIYTLQDVYINQKETYVIEDIIVREFHKNYIECIDALTGHIVCYTFFDFWKMFLGEPELEQYSYGEY